MRWWIGGLVLVLALATAGCASRPDAEQAAQQAEYESYWRCAHAAAMPYISDRELPPRQAAMRAQAQCYTSYTRYRDSKVNHVRSVVPSRDHAMATTLARQAALERRKLVTQRLAELVAEARQ